MSKPTNLKRTHRVTINLSSAQLIRIHRDLKKARGFAQRVAQKYIDNKYPNPEE